MSTHSHKPHIARDDERVYSPPGESVHIPVLLQEIHEYLNLSEGDVFCDATAGGGGHSALLGAYLGKRGVLLCLDQDEDALARTKERIALLPCVTHTHLTNFRNLDSACATYGITSVNAFLFDLGWSSDQIADPERGLSFMHDGPLTMTLKKNPSREDITAYDVVNFWQEETLADIIYAFGDERYARRIARGIVEARAIQPIKSTQGLVDIIKQSVPHAYRHGRLHPATRTFQALRIVVNDEYGAITEALEKAYALLAPLGKIAVITFHSGEDRIVKHVFQTLKESGKVVWLNKKVIVPSLEEERFNPRSRSAKLRIIQKI
ncbi:MAG: 16S rRNA (cytosine(1402)-N(4))-methyltransferase RsmH [Candidatus Pacebacteria bacterium]|nr:16S rRNA (cytosine(1402)-N(4))-methyltransferase RsmH [Candidatus Paceibacterota bacterium]MCD8507908.1 16S rRNA (cytosine(1402)-N(4))-methyltransferase RsmH [Candidatus Paceibacterota bacterium]MCD8528261.1 16S rRNA (cytosine(1402)-N(4))-methyltransferase RsmH [Candidatus Paceibacterota bacterium]MCD8563951.1 16S rRNA (cytosine(1402)-N(4))-methyltransferase RsmH [Candidatus Paceibacterota bacterium]